LRQISSGQTRRPRGLAAALALILSGCVCVDGGYDYAVRAKVVDAFTHTPIAYQSFTLTFDNPAPDDRRPDRIAIDVRSDADGVIETRYSTGLAWGSCEVPFYTPPPAPPMIGASIAPAGASSSFYLFAPSPVQQRRQHRTQCSVDLGTVAMYDVPSGPAR
jgi:hypothetical protein